LGFLAINCGRIFPLLDPLCLFLDDFLKRFDFADPRIPTCSVKPFGVTPCEAIAGRKTISIPQARSPFDEGNYPRIADWMAGAV
jgi:hypothetical protein